MAYNKDNYENQRLTPKQELFVEEIAKGKSQRQAYYEAYPRSRKWKERHVDSQASVLMKNPKVAKRLEELKKLTEKKVEWTRNRALNTINYVLEMNQKDMERINQAYDEELNLKEQELQQWVSVLSMENVDVSKVQTNIRRVMDEITNLKKIRRTSSVNTRGIYEGARLLNRMFGFDITKVEINQDDDERANMESLSVEELKAIAYANINRSDTDKS